MRSAAVSCPNAQELITGDIELTYRYPPYTGLSPRTVAGSNGEVSAPAGTEVLLKTRADRAALSSFFSRFQLILLHNLN